MNEKESKAEYWSEFNEKVNEVQQSLDSSSVTQENIVEIKNKISLLQVLVTSNIEILPKYDIRRSQEVWRSDLVFDHHSLEQEIDLLKKNTQIVEEKFQPRKKFAFSSRSKTKPEKRSTTRPPLFYQTVSDDLSLLLVHPRQQSR
jgi:hypothetical protein